MKLEYDKTVDALYISIQETEVARTLELTEGLNLDFDAAGKLIGLEILNALERYQPSDLFRVSSESLAMTEPTRGVLLSFGWQDAHLPNMHQIARIAISPSITHERHLF